MEPTGTCVLTIKKKTTIYYYKQTFEGGVVLVELRIAVNWQSGIVAFVTFNDTHNEQHHIKVRLLNVWNVNTAYDRFEGEWPVDVEGVIGVGWVRLYSATFAHTHFGSSSRNSLFFVSVQIKVTACMNNELCRFCFNKCFYFYFFISFYWPAT